MKQPGGTDDREASERGELSLGGCVIGRTSPTWACRACGHRWGGPPTRIDGVAAYFSDAKEVRLTAETDRSWTPWEGYNDSTFVPFRLTRCERRTGITERWTGKAWVNTAPGNAEDHVRPPEARQADSGVASPA